MRGPHRDRQRVLRLVRKDAAARPALGAARVCRRVGKAWGPAWAAGPCVGYQKKRAPKHPRNCWFLRCTTRAILVAFDRFVRSKCSRLHHGLYRVGGRALVECQLGGGPLKVPALASMDGLCYQTIVGSSNPKVETSLTIHGQVKWQPKYANRKRGHVYVSVQNQRFTCGFPTRLPLRGSRRGVPSDNSAPPRRRAGSLMRLWTAKSGSSASMPMGFRNERATERLSTGRWLSPFATCQCSEWLSGVMNPECAWPISNFRNAVLRPQEGRVRSMFVYSP